MPPQHSRQSLESMKRVDLQKLCKGYGVKANLKTEDLIDLLLDSQVPAPRGTSAPRSARSQPIRRSASIRPPSQASGPSRASSIIVHNVDDDEDEICDETRFGHLRDEALHSPVTVPPRTRKAKELQTRLGKGKPVIAGGSGPRAVTASSGSSQGRQTKLSKTMKPREPTIEEELEPSSAGNIPIPPVTEEQDETQHQDQRISPEETLTFVTDKIDALRNHIFAVKSEMTDLEGRVVEVIQSQKEILAELRNLQDLPSIILSLKDEIRRLRVQNAVTSRSGTPQPEIDQTNPIAHPISNILDPISRPSLLGASTSTLGKRHRDSTSSIVDDVVEESDQDALPDSRPAKSVRRDKKRLKLDSRGENTTTPHLLTGREAESGIRFGSIMAVCSGSEEPDPPLTHQSPETFLVDSAASDLQHRPGVSNSLSTSTANASENLPFSFAFEPMSSTAQNSMFAPSFPYPEAPQSPSPAGPSLSPLPNRQQPDRTDAFKKFGLPSPVRATRNYGASTGDERGINPAALQGPSSKKAMSSNEVAASLGLTAHRTTSSEQAGEAPTIRRTMYGTELDSDSRFGDFGVEGVASGFWLSK